MARRDDDSRPLLSRFLAGPSVLLLLVPLLAARLFCNSGCFSKLLAEEDLRRDDLVVRKYDGTCRGGGTVGPLPPLVSPDRAPVPLRRLSLVARGLVGWMGDGGMARVGEAAVGELSRSSFPPEIVTNIVNH